MKAALVLLALVAGATADSHDMITKEEWDQESKGKMIFLDMYADW